MKKKRARNVIINVYEQLQQQQQQQKNLYFDVFVVVIIIIIGRKFLFHVFFDLINSAIRKIGEKIVYFASFEMDQYTLKHVSSPS